MWRWFCELGGSRSSNGFGLNPISFTEIQAWAALTGAEPTPWEVGLLKRLDRVALSTQKTSSPGELEPEFEVAVDDTAGVKALFASFKARAAEVFAGR